MDAGGTDQGYAANLEAVLKRAPEDVQVIPGHGPLGGLEAVREALSVIQATRAKVANTIAEGTGVEAIIEAGLGSEYADWGSGFISEERWIRILARDLEERGH